MQEASDKVTSGSVGLGPEVVATTAIAQLRAVMVVNLADTDAADVTVALPQYLAQWARSPDIYALLLRSSRAPPPSLNADAATSTTGRLRTLAHHLDLCWRLDSFPKPLVALLDTPITAREIGLTTFGTHRVAGEGYRLSVPAFELGTLAAPAAGIAVALSRMPNHRGMELALTGRCIGRAEAYAAGLVTHCITNAAFPDIVAALADGQPVDPLLDSLHEDPGPPLDAPDEKTIARIFSGMDMTAIVASLGCETGTNRAWADAASKAINARPPLVNAALHRLIRAAAHLDNADSMVASYRVAAGLLEAADLNQSPSVASLDLVFSMPQSGDLSLPSRAKMENVRF